MGYQDRWRKFVPEEQCLAQDALWACSEEEYARKGGDYQKPVVGCCTLRIEEREIVESMISFGALPKTKKRPHRVGGLKETLEISRGSDQGIDGIVDVAVGFSGSVS